MEPNPVQPTPVEPPRPPRRVSLVGPVILILLGLAFLVNNLGLLQFNVWEMMWRLWPVWLIAAGLDMLVGRRSSWGSWVVLGLVVTIIGGSFWYFGNGVSVGGVDGIKSISQELKGAERASVEIRAGIGEMRIGPSENPATLVEGSIVRLVNERIVENASGSGSRMTYTLKSEGISVGPGVNVRDDATWNLRLSTRVPMDLQLGTGVGKSIIDLERLTLTRLDVNTGIGESTIILPSQGQFDVRIKSGIGKTVLEIPAGMAARIRATAGIGAVNVDGDFYRDGRNYVTQDFDTAGNRVEIEITGGIGEVQIRKR